MSEQAVEPFDPKAAAERLRERIRAGIFNMMTDEQVDQLVRQEYEAFCKGQFRETCRAAFVEQTKKLVEEHLKQWEGGMRWDPAANGGAGAHVPVLSALVKEWLTENHGRLLAGLVSDLLGGAAQRIIQMANTRY